MGAKSVSSAAVAALLLVGAALSGCGRASADDATAPDASLEAATAAMDTSDSAAADGPALADSSATVAEIAPSDAAQRMPADTPSVTDGPPTLDAASDANGDGAASDASATPAEIADSVDPPSDVAPAKPAGWTTGVCFAGLPATATSTGTVAMPSTELACPQLKDPEWFAPLPVPAPTLQAQVGYRDSTGSWHALADGDWVPLGTMLQGGFHLDLVPQVELPGKKDLKLQVQVDAFAAANCTVAASATLTKAWLVQAPGPEGLYTTDPTTKSFIVFVDSATKIQASCGIWLQVVWRVRLGGTSQWGQVVRTVRTYDGTGLAVGAPVSP